MGSRHVGVSEDEAVEVMRGWRTGEEQSEQQVCAAWERERGITAVGSCLVWLWREAGAWLSWEVPRNRIRGSGTRCIKGNSN